MVAPARVLVTGGARGTGAAIVRRLAAAGYAVGFTYAHSADAADDLVQELRQARSESAVEAYRCDFAETGEVEALASSLEEGPGHFGLVHNAGATYDALAATVDAATAERLMRVNFWSFVRLVRALVRPMSAGRQGRVVVIGSLTAERGTRGNAVYAASKAALKGFATTLMTEVARRGVTVNYVAPGFVDTDMLAPYASVRAELEKKIPAGRFGAPQDVAGTVAFLLSDDAAYINGATIPVDGGLGAALAAQG